MPNLLVKFVLFIFVVLLNHAFANGQSADEYIKKANDEYRNGNYNQASELYDSAILAGDTKMVTLYNATCSHALAGNRDRAFELLEKIVDDGFMESDWLRKDEDLASLRDDEHWAKLMNTITENRRKLEESFPMEHKIIKSIDLPEPALEGKVSVESAISDRRSRRSYAAEPLTIAEIGQVLWAAYGISQPIESGPEFLRGGLRTAPSAGALYPLDIYLVAGEVEGLEPGIYLYDSRNHKLGLLKSGDIRKELCNAGNGQLMIERAPATLVYSAIFSRTTGKYGDRGRERYVCMDIGHSAENVYLQAEALGLGTCAVGAFNDLALKSVINMTRPEEPLYLMPLGRQK